MEGENNAVQLAELKLLFARIMGQQGNSNGDFDVYDKDYIGDNYGYAYDYDNDYGRTYILDLVIDAFVACHPHIVTMLNVCNGASKFLYPLLAKATDLQISILDVKGTVLEVIHHRILLLNPGKAILNSTDFLKSLPSKARFESVVLESVMTHLNFTKDGIILLRKLFTALIPGGTLWITEVLPVGAGSSQPLDLRARYLTTLAKITAAHQQPYIDAIAGNALKFNLCQLFLDLKSVGFQRVDLIYKHLGAMAIVAFK